MYNHLMYDSFHDDFIHNSKHSIGLWFRENVYKDYNYKGIVFEVGGGDPEHLSFSKHFIMNGWDAYIFEPNPSYAQKHRDAGNNVYQVAVSDEISPEKDFYIFEDENKVALGWSSLGLRMPDCKIKPKIVQIPVITLNSFLEENNINYVDIISVDVEGWEPEVVDGFDEKKYNVRFFVLEMNGYLSEINQLVEKMKRKGYHLVCSNHINWIFEKLNKKEGE